MTLSVADRHLRAIVLATVLAAACAGALAQPAAKPPLRILVGFVAGGTTDQAARLLAEHLRGLLDRPVIVDNKPGASGRIAAAALRNAAPDGNTVMLAPMVVTTLAPMVWPTLDYDPARDFAPVAHVADYAIALAVGTEIPARDVRELAAWMRASPERATYGLSAAGSLPHLFGVIVGRSAGIPWIAVPYRGLAPMEVDLAGGRIAAAMDALSNLIELHRSGRARIIATSGESRSALLPDVPTFVEQGQGAIEGNGWIAIHAPAGTPKPAIDAISAAVARSVRMPQVRAQMIRLGYEPTGTSAGELADIAHAEAVRWGPIVRSTGFRAD